MPGTNEMKGEIKTNRDLTHCTALLVDISTSFKRPSELTDQRRKQAGGKYANTAEVGLDRRSEKGVHTPSKDSSRRKGKENKSNFSQWSTKSRYTNDLNSIEDLSLRTSQESDISRTVKGLNIKPAGLHRGSGKHR